MTHLWASSQPLSLAFLFLWARWGHVITLPSSPCQTPLVPVHVQQPDSQSLPHRRHGLSVTCYQWCHQPLYGMTDVKRQPVWERSLNQLINAMSAAAALSMIKVSAWRFYPEGVMSGRSFVQKGLCLEGVCPEEVMSGGAMSSGGYVWLLIKVQLIDSLSATESCSKVVTK